MKLGNTVKFGERKEKFEQIAKIEPNRIKNDEKRKNKENSLFENESDEERGNEILFENIKLKAILTYSTFN